MNHREGDGVVELASIEAGMRLLVLLVELFPLGADVEKAFYFDFLMMHSGTYEGGPASLHPPDPFASGTLTIRREAVRQGLLFFAKHGLIEEKYTEAGVEYAASESAGVFVDQLESPYFMKAKSAAEWIRREYGGLNREGLNWLVEAAADIWRSQFEPLSVIEDLEGGNGD